MSQRPTDDDDDDFWAEARALGIAQAKALKDQAGKGGLRFEAYLPPELRGRPRRSRCVPGPCEAA